MEMKTFGFCVLPIFFPTIITFSMISAPNAASSYDDLIGCLSKQFQNTTSQVFFTPNDSSYMSILLSTIQNLRFTSPDTPKPFVIITPHLESQVAKAVICCQKKGVQMRVRSGGHDYEGLSYISRSPFAIIDLFNLHSVKVDVRSKTTWVQAGATIGELYYAIGNTSNSLGFPCGLCATVGLGGQISGGGYGMMVRKFGLAADHVADARIVDANGRIRDRKSMGEDVFWAIRGGGGGSFGVIVAWKLKLVTVPEIVTVFAISKTLEENATQLVHLWQYIAPKTDENLVIKVYLKNQNTHVGKTVVASFSGFFLGRKDALLLLMQREFPELGLAQEECTEMSWIDSMRYFHTQDSRDDLRNRTNPYKGYLKMKSDLVTDPIPQKGLEGIWERFLEEDAPQIELIPLGGKMDNISPWKIPFPHRSGNIYLIYSEVKWFQGAQAYGHLSWIQELYDFMTPYVSKNPRKAYVNYRDLDIGVNNEANGKFEEASQWGFKYFSNNFYRLVKEKTLIDPGNFFRHEQSIPPATNFLLRDAPENFTQSIASA